MNDDKNLTEQAMESTRQSLVELTILIGEMIADNKINDAQLEICVLQQGLEKYLNTQFD